VHRFHNLFDNSCRTDKALQAICALEGCEKFNHLLVVDVKTAFKRDSAHEHVDSKFKIERCSDRVEGVVRGVNQFLNKKGRPAEAGLPELAVLGGLD
jgi:hypothetical protein